ncbi:MAG: tRNA (adenosine(37)-N6)-dimethylallyltransferase MiaA [Patescibacteria group bacterium]|jgi:tRNA dimethylallyltransferase
MSDLPKLIIILGPTASGKTDLSLKLAREFNGEIIAADSRTLYRGMNIGTAKPEGELQADGSLLVEGIVHWGIDVCNPGDTYSVADFKKYAEEKIEEIVARGHVPFLVGGIGLFIQAVIEDLSLTNVPPNPELRATLEALSIEELSSRINAFDKNACAQLDLKNRRRLIRALEILEGSKGQKFLSRTLKSVQTKGEGKYDVLQIGVQVDRAILNERINLRVDAMIAHGLVGEVRALKEKYGCDANAMTGIGYREICEFLDGECSEVDAIEKIKSSTRQYAKRQMTWFKRDERIHWVASFDEARSFIASFLK